jgi:hypothetical protein
MIAGEALGVAALEVVAPELAVRLTVAQHVAGDDEEVVGNRDDGFLVAAASRAGGTCAAR